jgi:hypothetical protein
MCRCGCIAGVDVHIKKAPGGLTHLLTAVDKFTKWIVVRPLAKIVMRASLPLYHLPLMTLLVVLMFSINPMIYVLDQLQEHVPSYWNNR